MAEYLVEHRDEGRQNALRALPVAELGQQLGHVPGQAGHPVNTVQRVHLPVSCHNGNGSSSRVQNTDKQTLFHLFSPVSLTKTHGHTEYYRKNILYCSPLSNMKRLIKFCDNYHEMFILMGHF